MIDLTPLDVRKKRGDFRRILRGYDPEEVDSFLELAAERLEELVKNNLVLSERVENLERSLNTLELRESAVQEALVTAQRLRSEVQEQSRRDAETLRDQAQREAHLLKAESEAEIARRLGEVQGQVLESRRSLEDLERSRRKFLKAFRGLLERELDTVEVEEARTPLDEIPLELELSGWFPGVAVTGREREVDDPAQLGGFDTQILPIGEEPFAAEEAVSASEGEILREESFEAGEEPFAAEEAVSALEGEILREESFEADEEPFAAEEAVSASEGEILREESFEADEEPFAAEEAVSASEGEILREESFEAGEEPFAAEEAAAMPDAKVPHEEPPVTPAEGAASEPAGEVLPVAALAPDAQDDQSADASGSTAEPKWLFSLLKRADEVKRKDDV
jgi:cell division initiation protein